MHGGSAASAAHETLQLAEAADRLGYTRYWVAEHHNSGGLASATPEIMIGQIAARTERIRVGSGGVMLPHYSPLKVAEVFRLLETLFPGRIDLGVGRAPGSDARTARAMAYKSQPFPVEEFPEQLLDLYGFLADAFPEDHEFSGIRAIPDCEGIPELWMLGSSDVGAGLAADLGWSYCYAHFINPERIDTALDAYRKLFEPSPVLDAPRASIAISAVAAETHEEAERLMWSRWSWPFIGRRLGGSIPTPEEAMAHDYLPAEREYIEHQKLKSVYGSPSEVREKIEAMAAKYEVDEIMIVTITADYASRVRSYELLAEEFGLA